MKEPRLDTLFRARLNRRTLLTGASSALVTPLLGRRLQAATTAAIRFAVIGDYGSNNLAAQKVATLVRSWNPDFIITTGDNNYNLGGADTIDANIGQYYHDFIYQYRGSYGAGASLRRFFPCLGNHDWQTPNAQPYFDYFSLPFTYRYYDYVRGPVHFFVLDSDPQEPDGVTATSRQGQWLRSRLAAAQEPWKLVYFHHSPFSSGIEHGSNAWMQWPFQAWGAHAVLSGHDHDYERIVLNGFPYFVNGMGGADYIDFTTPVAGSQVCYNNHHGAMLVAANATGIQFQFFSHLGVQVDTYTLGVSPPQPPLTAPTDLVATVLSSSTIQVAWKDRNTAETGFEIERAPETNPFSRVATVQASTTTHISRELRPQVKYSFRVRAFAGTTYSPYSAVATVQTPAQ